MIRTATRAITRTVRIGVDIGGTKIEAVAIDQDCTVLHTVRRPTGFGNEALLSSLFGVLDELRGAETLADCAVSRLGIGIPGTVNTESGYVANAVNVGVAGLELGSLVEAEQGLSVAVENDVNAAAVGAHYLLADGDPVAKVVQQRFFEGVATAIRILGLTYDPSPIYIGGGLNALGQPLLSGIQRELARFSAPSPFLSGLALGDRVQLVPPGLSIGSVGAAIAAD